MFQNWCQVTFLHWRYDAGIVRHLVPQPLEVETFDGAAWVAVAPFIVQNLHPVFAPSLPWISNFPETNCRTYVRGPDGGPGVWFFSLDAARAPAVMGARLAYGLPYAWSRMRVARKGAEVHYESRRRWPDRFGITNIRVAERNPVEQGDLEIFLTARFRLYSFIRGGLTYTSVEHPPWPLKGARVLVLQQTLTAAAGLPDPVGPPLAHFSPGVAVKVAAPKRI
jgi:uncharacterized protein YqjF (DUF2071 family)